MGIARCVCYTNAKPAIKAEERVTRLQNSVKLSLLCFFSDILFALKARDAHCVSREYHSAYDEYNCVSNITRREANRTGVILRLEYHAKRESRFYALI